MRLQIDCQSLGELDGGAARAIINAAIREAVHDTEDRGEDGKPRKVNIVLTFLKRKNGQVEVAVEAIPKVPMRRTASTVTEIKHSNGRPTLQFSVAAPEDPKQATIDEFESR